MDQRIVRYVLATLTCFAGVLCARAGTAEDQAALDKALGGAKLTLQQGLQAASVNGKPISGKYEMEDGKLQLSVYTTNQSKFYEVIVDYGKGSVSKVEEIKEGDDLAAAKAQSSALSGVKSTLSSAVGKAVHDAVGFKAVSVEPEKGPKGVVAKVTLTKGGEAKSIEVPLK